jgi:hypothetical protein
LVFFSHGCGHQGGSCASPKSSKLTPAG